MMRDSSSVRLIWSLSRTPDSGGFGSGPLATFFPFAWLLAWLAWLRMRLARQHVFRQFAFPTSPSLQRSLLTVPLAAPVPPVCPSLPVLLHPPLRPSPSAAPPPPLTVPPTPSHAPNSTRCVWTHSPGPCSLLPSKLILPSFNKPIVLANSRICKKTAAPTVSETVAGRWQSCRDPDAY